MLDASAPKVKLKAVAGGESDLAETIVVPLSGPIPWQADGEATLPPKHEPLPRVNPSRPAQETGAVGGAELRDMMAQAMASQLSPWESPSAASADGEEVRREPPEALELAPPVITELGSEQEALPLDDKAPEEDDDEEETSGADPAASVVNTKKKKKKKKK